jgi:tRNA (pseudouridine54-N1)-methyltransferase
MRTFVIRSRSANWEKLKESIGAKGHFEIVAHCIMNAFFISNGFRDAVEVYIVLDSASDFPRTLQLSHEISLDGFHETAIIDFIVQALRSGADIQKNESRVLQAGVKLHGFGFEKCIAQLMETRPVYLLDKKGEDIRATDVAENPVFILSDHLALPKNNVKSLMRKGMQTISLGKKMLFASQCVVLIHDELDRKGC